MARSARNGEGVEEEIQRLRREIDYKARDPSQNIYLNDCMPSANKSPSADLLGQPIKSTGNLGLNLTLISNQAQEDERQR